MNIVSDMIQVKQVERKLGRRLNWAEQKGLLWVKMADGRLIRIKQFSLQWLHNKNSCK